jgi:hypothetical protein
MKNGRFSPFLPGFSWIFTVLFSPDFPKREHFTPKRHFDKRQKTCTKTHKKGQNPLRPPPSPQGPHVTRSTRASS